MANWFPSIWKEICTTRSWKNDEKRRYFNADMGIAVCPLSNSRTFWPFELTSDRRVSPILPISTLQSPNQGAIHKLRSQGSFGAFWYMLGPSKVPFWSLFGPYLYPFCVLSVPFLCPFCCPFCALSMFYCVLSMPFLRPIGALSLPFVSFEPKWHYCAPTLKLHVISGCSQMLRIQRFDGALARFLMKSFFYFFFLSSFGIKSCEIVEFRAEIDYFFDMCSMIFWSKNVIF